MQRKPLIAGNWKMNGDPQMAVSLCGAIAAEAETVDVDIAICPPTILLHSVAALLKATPIALGAQDVDSHDNGAYTGQTSAQMLQDAGCDYVIIGHSERRTLFGENDQTVASKLSQALQYGLAPILCIGETAEERDTNETENVIARQINKAFTDLSEPQIAKIVIAYEPVWAIGTGNAATPTQAQEIHHYIRSLLTQTSDKIAQTCRILYGGSMNAENAKELLAMPDIDGGLIGGASLKADAFVNICQSS